MDQFGLVQFIDWLSQSVVVAVSLTTHRILSPGLGEAFV